MYLRTLNLQILKGLSHQMKWSLYLQQKMHFHAKTLKYCIFHIEMGIFILYCLLNKQRHSLKDIQARIPLMVYLRVVSRNTARPNKFLEEKQKAQSMRKYTILLNSLMILLIHSGISLGNMCRNELQSCGVILEGTQNQIKWRN